MPSNYPPKAPGRNAMEHAFPQMEPGRKKTSADFAMPLDAAADFADFADPEGPPSHPICAICAICDQTTLLFPIPSVESTQSVDRRNHFFRERKPFGNAGFSSSTGGNSSAAISPAAGSEGSGNPNR